MNPKLLRNFTQGLKPVLVQSQILAITALTTKLEKSKTCCVFSFLAILLFPAYTIYTIYKIICIAEVTRVYFLTEILSLVVRCACVVAIWSCAILKMAKMRQAFTDILKFDENLQNFGTTINYLKQRRKDLIEVLIRNVVIFLIVVDFVYVRLYLVKTEGWTEAVRTVTHVVKSGLVHQSVQLISMLRIRFSILNKHLGKLSCYKTNKRQKVNTLYKICAMHHHLCKVINTFNEAFGFQLLMMFTVSFMTVSICCFYISANIKKGFDLAFISMASTVFLHYSVDIILVCNGCYKTVQEAKMTRDIIHRIETEDKEMMDEMEMFSLQICNSSIEFSAAEFFSVDNGLIFPIIGGATTYIIILDQLSAAL